MLDYLTALSRRPGPQFEVVAPSDGPLRDELASLGIPVRICGPDGRQSGAEYEAAVEQLAGLIAAGEFDAVWANTVVSFAAVDAATRIGVPSFWFIHEGLEPPQFWAPEAAAGLIGRHAYERCLAALRSASIVACVARAARRTFLPYRDRTIALVPNSIDLAPIREYQAAHDRTEVRAQLGFGALDRLVLSVAPIVPHKGQSLLAQAFAALVGAHPRTVCVLIGDIGQPYGAAIAGYAAKLGLADRIRVLPPVEDIYQWFLAAFLFVLPWD
jgi:glycosyltransferase involved in cell wall biosynthesis